MSKKELRDFCIKHNLPFTVEFKEPWYPKPIEIPLENANNLHSMMEEEIKNKESQIASLQNDIETINITKREAETFMENISKLI